MEIDKELALMLKRLNEFSETVERTLEEANEKAFLKLHAQLQETVTTMLKAELLQPTKVIFHVSHIAAAVTPKHINTLAKATYPPEFLPALCFVRGPERNSSYCKTNSSLGQEASPPKGN